VTFNSSAGQTAGITDGGTYYIRNNLPSSKHYMEESNGIAWQNTIATNIEMIPCQRWRVIYYGHGLYWLLPMNGCNTHTGNFSRALTADTYGNIYVDDRNDPNPAIGQLFSIIQISSGIYSIRPAVTGSVLALRVADGNVGTWVTTAAVNTSSDYQKWKFEEITSYTATVKNYFDQGYKLRMAALSMPPPATSIASAQELVNNVMLSQFNLTITSPAPAHFYSDADKCADNLTGSKYQYKSQCINTVPSSHTCSNCTPIPHCKNIGRLSSITPSSSQPTVISKNVVWIGNVVCNNCTGSTHNPWQGGTACDIRCMMFPWDDWSEDSGRFELLLHELGHSFGAAGDVYHGPYCITGADRPENSVYDRVDGGNHDVFCSKCRAEIQTMLAKYY